jgi:phage terminase large subunit
VSRLTGVALQSLKSRLARTKAELVPPAFQCLFDESKSYLVMYGGRGSAKLWSIARTLLIKGTQKKLRVLCTREIQESLKASAYKLLVDQITALELQSFYSVRAESIHGKNGTEFFFAGLHRNADGLRSYEGVNAVWVEEAQFVSDASWEALIPTVSRNDGYQIFVSFNPMTPSDPVMRRFVDSGEDDTLARKVSWRDNPHLSKGAHKERLKLERMDPAEHRHVWEGYPRISGEDSILPAAWVESAIDAHIKLNITPSGIKRGAFDMADEGKDRCCFVARHGILVFQLESWSGKGSTLYDSCGRMCRLYDAWGLNAGAIYDATGMGAHMKGDLRRINEDRVAQGHRPILVTPFLAGGVLQNPKRVVPGTEITAGELYANRAAEGWGVLKEAFRLTHDAVVNGRTDIDPDSVISLSSKLPELDKLVVELSQPQWKQSGVKQAVDKYGDNGPSPNRADATMFLWATQLRPGVRITPEAAALFRDPNWRQMSYSSGPRFRSLPPRPESPKAGTPEWYEWCEQTGTNCVGGSGSMGADELRHLCGGR